jgi:hypothetical protein
MQEKETPRRQKGTKEDSVSSFLQNEAGEASISQQVADYQYKSSQIAFQKVRKLHKLS